MSIQTITTFAWAGFTAAILLFVLSALFSLRSLKDKQPGVRLFALFGLAGAIFVYVGIIRNLPQIDTEYPIRYKVAEMESLKSRLQEQQTYISGQINSLSKKNDDLIREAVIMKRDFQIASFDRASHNPAMSGTLQFMQQNLQNVRQLQASSMVLEKQIKEIEMLLASMHTEKIKYQAAGGFRTSIEQYKVEEKLTKSLASFQYTPAFENLKVEETSIEEIWADVISASLVEDEDDVVFARK